MALDDHELRTLITALQDDKIHVTHAIRACEGVENEAINIAMFMLGGEPFRSNPIIRDADFLHAKVYRTFEFIWQLGSASHFVKCCWAGHLTEVSRAFIQRKLYDKPDEFSDEDLHYLTFVMPLGEVVASAANQVKRDRMITRVERINEQPRELSKDVQKVKSQVSHYNFDADLNALLDKVESGLGSGDAFDQSAMLGHLRTFFEKLHEHVGTTLRQRKPATVDGTPLNSCGQAIDYLQRKGVLTDKMQALGRALYGVLSDEGVHAIKSDREYVRLCRNMVAEYALVLFFELEGRLREP